MMVVNKRKKNTREHGLNTHGGGAKKKRRGAGSRGGRGAAGTGKRAGHKKIEILKKYGNAYFGNHGFSRPQKILRSFFGVNLDYLDSHLDIYVNKKLVTKEGDLYVVDVEKLGFGKVLGRGEPTHKIKLKAPRISKKAIEKINKAGGVIEGEQSNKLD